MKNMELQILVIWVILIILIVAVGYMANIIFELIEKQKQLERAIERAINAHHELTSRATHYANSEINQRLVVSARVDKLQTQVNLHATKLDICKDVMIELQKNDSKRTAERVDTIKLFTKVDILETRMCGVRSALDRLS